MIKHNNMKTFNTNDTANDPREILPKSLIISRDGFLQVTRKTTVMESEKLYFCVPKKQMERAVDTLQVIDSRGTNPRIIFPSSFFCSDDSFKLRSEDAWSDLVARQQGAFIQVLMGDHDCAEGHLIGLRRDGAGESEKTSLLLLRDGQVSAHNIETVTTISFRESRASAELKKYTTSKKFDLDTKDNYSITIIATGSGPGEISVSYSQFVSGAPFTISYLITPADGASAYGIQKNMLLNSFATIRNPLSCDIKDVEVTIQGQMYQNFPKTDMYPEDRGNEGEGQVARSDGSSENYEPAEDAENPSVSGEFYDVDDLFDHGTISASQTSVEAYYDFHREVRATATLSLKEGCCTKISLFHAQCEVGLSHYYRAGIDRCSLDLYIRNTTGRNLEPGYGQFSSPDIASTHMFSMPFLKKSERALIPFRRYTGCRGSVTSTSLMERVVSSSKVNEKLLATIMFRRTIQYTLHNLEEKDVDVLLFHKTAQCSTKEVESEAIWYDKLLAVGAGQQNGKGSVVQPSPGDLRTLTDYHVHVASKERCRLIVTEYVKKDVEVPLLENISVKLVANLEKNNIIGRKLVDGLLDMLATEREIELLTKKRRAHRKRLKALVNIQHVEAEKHEDYTGGSGPDLDSGHADNEICDKYMQVVARSEKEMKTIQEALDCIDYSLISLQHELKSKKKALTETEALT